VADMIESGMQHYRLRLPQPTRIGEEQLEGLDMPVLAIIAGASVMHDADAAVDTAERTLREGTVLLYEDASHAVNGEQPDQIAADLEAFLNEHTR
jgi:pimeloyl-ACP methyl ester carboxylesterase